jgi:hypothetical protein
MVFLSSFRRTLAQYLDEAMETSFQTPSNSSFVNDSTIRHDIFPNTDSTVKQ